MISKKERNDILYRQLALDYCCSPEQVRDEQNHFTEHRILPGRRSFREGDQCFLKAAAVNGKLLFTGSREMVDWCRDRYGTLGSAWFFEPETLMDLNERLHREGWKIMTAHPFYLPDSDRLTEPDTEGWEIRWYEGGDLDQFRGDVRYERAYSFDPGAPDMIGAAAVREGQILGMAGASCDSPTMWQIGIDVDPAARRTGVGRMLVILLKNEIMRRGILPFYGTAMSHIASQRVAHGAGFAPAWAELVTGRLEAGGPGS